MKKELSIYLSTTDAPICHMTRDDFIKYARIYDWTPEVLRRYRMLKATPVHIAGEFNRGIEINRFINKPSFTNYLRGLHNAYNADTGYGIAPAVGFIAVIPHWLDRGGIWDHLMGYSREPTGFLHRAYISDVDWDACQDGEMLVCEVCIGASRLPWAPGSRTVESTSKKCDDLVRDLLVQFDALDDDLNQWLQTLKTYPVELYNNLIRRMPSINMQFDSHPDLGEHPTLDHQDDLVRHFLTTASADVVEKVFADYEEVTYCNPLEEIGPTIEQCLLKVPVKSEHRLGPLLDLGYERNAWFWRAAGLANGEELTLAVFLHLIKMLGMTEHSNFLAEIAGRYWLDREVNVRVYIDGNQYVDYGSRTVYDAAYDTMGTGTILDYMLNPVYTTPGVVGSAYDFLASLPEWTSVTATLSDEPVGYNSI